MYDVLGKIEIGCSFVFIMSNDDLLRLFSHRCSLPKDAKTFFDKDTGVLEVPMAVQVVGQVCMIYVPYASTGSLFLI